MNGKTILIGGREENVLEYFHLEFDGRDVIDAEGAPCESHQGEREACAPRLSFAGGRSQFYSHLRSAFAPITDRRLPLDRIRDGLELRAFG